MLKTIIQHIKNKIIFSSAMKKFINHGNHNDIPEKLINDLIEGWGNKDWSARNDFIRVSIKEASKCKGTILECGSGLTTLLIGIVAGKNGRELWSLENSTAWAARVRKHLKKYGISNAYLCLGDLKNYGEYEWYGPSMKLIPDNISLILCDGPPASVKGGRYGVLPIMRGKLGKGCVILLDDYNREDEQRIMDRWIREYELDKRDLTIINDVAKITIS